MEQRLVPINGILDLCTRDGLNPASLIDSGWELRGLEIPVKAAAGNVTIDLILFHADSGRLLVLECKSGVNLDVEQARKLVALTPALVVDAAGITVPVEVQLTCSAAYVCLSEHADKIRMSLASAGLEVPVIGVGVEQVQTFRTSRSGYLADYACCV